MPENWVNWTLPKFVQCSLRKTTLACVKRPNQTSIFSKGIDSNLANQTWLFTSSLLLAGAHRYVSMMNESTIAAQQPTALSQDSTNSDLRHLSAAAGAGSATSDVPGVMCSLDREDSWWSASSLCCYQSRLYQCWLGRCCLYCVLPIPLHWATIGVSVFHRLDFDELRGKLWRLVTLRGYNVTTKLATSFRQLRFLQCLTLYYRPGDLELCPFDLK